MNNKITAIIDRVNVEEWAKFVDIHPNGNFFQTPGFVDLINSVPNYRADVVSYIVKDKINGILVYTEQKEGSGIKGSLTNRCIVYGGPLLLNEGKVNEITGSLLEKLREQTGAIYIEFRNLFDTTGLKNIFESRNYSYQPHLNYILHLNQTTEENLRLLHSSRRWEIRKSLKSGAIIIIPSAIDEVRDFYHILLQLYKQKIKKPLPPWQFFENFFQKQNNGKYFLIKFKGQIIAGVMCPIYKKTIYEWYLAGIDSKYKTVYPSVLSTWAPMEYAAKNGLKYYNFMGAGKPDTDYGVRKFKSKFGGKEVEYGRYLFINKPILYKVGKLGLRLYKMIT